MFYTFFIFVRHDGFREDYCTVVNLAVVIPDISYLKYIYMYFSPKKVAWKSNKNISDVYVCHILKGIFLDLLSTFFNIASSASP